jgi:acyl dehydratase
MRTINGFEELHAAKGEELGTSEWHEIDQDTINAFADVTGDHQWIHVDVERAKDSPFGSTIAHGFYTLALYPKLLDEIVSFEGFNFGLNYGTNKVRFVSPVPVNSKVRGTAKLADVTEVSGGAQAMIEMTWEIDGAEKPACIGEHLVRFYG